MPLFCIECSIKIVYLVSAVSENIGAFLFVSFYQCAIGNSHKIDKFSVENS